MFENPRRGRQARNFTTNVPKIVFRTDIFRKLSLGAPDSLTVKYPYQVLKLGYEFARDLIELQRLETKKDKTVLARKVRKSLFKINKTMCC